jgi:hypothetical protein
MTRIYLKEKKVEIPKKALKWNPNGSRKPDCAKRLMAKDNTIGGETDFGYRWGHHC